MAWEACLQVAAGGWSVVLGVRAGDWSLGAAGAGSTAVHGESWMELVSEAGPGLERGSAVLDR